MKKLLNFYGLVSISIFLTIIFCNPIFARTPKLKRAAKVTDIQIIQSDPQTGKLTLEISIEGKLNIGGTFRINTWQGVKLLQNSQKTNEFQDRIELFSLRTVKRNFVFQVDSGAYSMVKIFLEAPDVPAGYGKSAYKDFKLFNDGKTIHLIERGKSDIFKPRESGKDFTIKKGTSHRSTEQLQNYVVNVNGRVKFEPIEGGDDRGVYGNDIVLWFRNSNDPDGNWYHPIVGNQQHIHYDVLDAQGNYNFNFSFNGDLSGYDQLILLISTTNRATLLPVPSDGYIVYHDNGYSTYYNESEGLVANIDPTQSNITISQDISNLNDPDAAVFRYMMFARDFVYALYNGNPPFSLPAVQTFVTDISPAGLFHVNCITGEHYIEIDPAWYDAATITHEYGHYLNYKMWNNCTKYLAATDEIVEGWAIFHSFAVRNYANRNYGDNIRDRDDNTEIAPFQNNPRYRSIRYAYAGEPDKAASACVFWNLYDDYANSQFEAVTYDNGDNDDISNYKKRVYERYRTFNTVNILGEYDLRTETYKDHFKRNIPPSDSMDVATQASVNKVYDFMFSDLYNIPPQKMRAAQVSNFNGIVQSSSKIDFYWDLQNYSGSLLYGNYESGYKLYKENGSSWALVTTIPAGNTYYTYSAPNASERRYKITSYNSGGESSKSPIFSPLSVTITGPTHLNSGQTGEFTANPSGGSSPYTNYKWWSRNDEGGIEPNTLNRHIVPNAPPAGEWIYLSQWEGHQTITMGPSYDFSLKCEVTDSDNNTATDIHSVIVGSLSLSEGEQDSTATITMIPTELALK